MKVLLLVEDEFLIAMGKQQELEEYGYKVIHTNTGEKAVKLSEENSEIDLILMDIDLGCGMDGTEAAELILKEIDIPILFMSSHTEKQIVEKTEGITAYGYVVKSSNITVLDASIKMAFKLFNANKRTEKHRQQLNITLNSIGDAVIATDTGGAVSNMNPVAEKLTGWVLNDAGGRPLTEVFNIINSETRESVDNPVEKVLENGQIIGLANHTILIAKDKREFQIADSAAPIIDSNGVITGVVLVFRDVTEEYRIKQEFYKSEKRYRLLFESTIEGICLHELVYDDLHKPVDYRILDANNKYEEILNLDRNDVIGKLATEIYGSDDAPYLDIYAGVAESGDSDQFQVFFEPMKKHFIISVFSPEKGQFATIFEDITERKNAEDEIYALSRFPGENPNPVLRISAQGKIIYANDASRCLVETWGYSREQILPERIGTIVKSVVESGVNQELETECREKQLSLFIAAVKGADYVNIYASDITGKNKEKKAAAQRELDLYNALDSAPFPIMIHSEDGRVKMINKVWTELTGYSHEDIPTTAVWSQKAAGAGSTASEAEKGKLHKFENIVKENEYIVRTLGGNELIWDLSSAPLGFFAGEKCAVISMAQDVTLRKKLEDNIKEQLLEKEIILKETHHRIKNNIIAIENLLSYQADATDNAETEENLKTAIGRIKGMSMLYERLLLTGEYQTASVKNYLDNLIDEIAALLFWNFNLVIEKNLDDILLEPKKLFSIGLIVNELFTNILKHAFKNRDSGIIEVVLKENNGETVLTIQDDGNGLPEGFDIDKENAFGLKLVKMLTGQLDGTFCIENHNGTRSTIKFRI